MPTTTKQALRIYEGMPSFKPESPDRVTATAGPDRNGAGMPSRLARSAPMLPMMAVSKNVWNSGLIIIATRMEIAWEAQSHMRRFGLRRQHVAGKIMGALDRQSYKETRNVALRVPYKIVS